MNSYSYCVVAEKGNSDLELLDRLETADAAKQSAEDYIKLGKEGVYKTYVCYVNGKGWKAPARKIAQFFADQYSK